MKTFLKITLLPCVCFCLFAACNTAKKSSENENQPIAFKEAHNYFLRNDAPEMVNALFTSQEQFDRFFGCATTMGKDGRPTPINFTKLAAIALVVPATEIATEITPLSVQVQDGKLVCDYEVKRGQNIGYTTQPLKILIIDGKYRDMQVVLREH